MDEFKQGIYKHYRTQGLYHAICLVKHHDSRQDYVLYSSLEHGTLNVRPLHGYPGDPDGFLDKVEIPHPVSYGDSSVGPRFEYVGFSKE